MQNQSFDVTNCDVVIVQYVSETNVFFFFSFFHLKYLEEEEAKAQINGAKK